MRIDPSGPLSRSSLDLKYFSLALSISLDLSNLVESALQSIHDYSQGQVCFDLFVSINNGCDCYASHGNVVEFFYQKCLSQSLSLATCYNNSFSVQFVFISCNDVAHCLADFGSSIWDSLSCFDNCPWFLNVAIGDLQ